MDSILCLFFCRMNPLYEEGRDTAEVRQASRKRTLVQDISDETKSAISSLGGAGSSAVSGSATTLPLYHCDDQVSNDYRRQFVLGRHQFDSAALNNEAPRLEKAFIAQLNRQFVAGIEMVSQQQEDDCAATRPQEERRLSADYFSDESNLASLPQCMAAPEPVWPSKQNHETRNNVTPIPCRLEDANSAVIEQNESYVTKILISPAAVVSGDRQSNGRKKNRCESFDSIITDSLLMWTSYEIADYKDKQDIVPLLIMAIEEADDCQSEAAIRELSETMSQSKTIATISRAFGKSYDNNHEEALQRPRFTSGSVTDRFFDANKEIHSTRKSGSSSLTRGLSMMKDFWEKNAVLGNGRRLLVESDDEEQAISSETTDGRFQETSGALIDLVAEKNANKASSFSSTVTGFKFIQPSIKYENIDEISSNVTVNNRFNVLRRGGSFEHDRLSNSSSRSSGSRRVTFSADTVDNEPSTKSTMSNSSRSSTHSRELKLNAQYLPRYQHPIPNEYTIPAVHDYRIHVTPERRYGNHYVTNLQMHKPSESTADKR